MRSQRCTQCGTKLDVSRMEKGSKMACSNCGSVLVVGEVEQVGGQEATDHENQHVVQVQIHRIGETEFR